MAIKPIHAVGRRKTAVARVFMKSVEGDDGAIEVNGRPYEVYFQGNLSRMAVEPLVTTERLGKYSIKVNLAGGGITGQVGAFQLGVARALQKAEADFHPILRKAGFLTRDSRMVERKKAGRHKARKSTQFSKR